MFEKHHQPLASKKEFASRIFKALLINFLFLFVLLSGGIIGYHFIAKIGWVDSFENASMILAGMGPVAEMPDKASKIFAGCYALVSGIGFLTGFAIIFAPVLHRFMHLFHIESDDNDK